MRTPSARSSGAILIALLLVACAEEPPPETTITRLEVAEARPDRDLDGLLHDLLSGLAEDHPDAVAPRVLKLVPGDVPAIDLGARLAMPVDGEPDRTLE